MKIKEKEKVVEGIVYLLKKDCEDNYKVLKTDTDIFINGEK